ncbi:WD repeat and FYVE domain-containing protein 2 [Exaiptasia diaphana]|nr:WD repeat and FYVE domain-containing protein 2 [Exaiptasia diaphana]
MAATIKDTEQDRTRRSLPKPTLVNKLEGCSDVVNMAVPIPHEDAIISVSDDNSVRLWIKRESGQYWPSICHMMADACSSLDYHGTSRRLFVGLASGTITIE